MVDEGVKFIEHAAIKTRDSSLNRADSAAPKCS